MTWSTRGAVTVIALVLSACASTPPESPTSASSAPPPASTPASPAVVSAPRSTELPCDATNFSWQACPGIRPVGSLIDSVSRRSGAVDVWWSSNCGCPGGIARGQGEARWCERGIDCRQLDASAKSNSWLGSVVGVMSENRLIGPAVVNTGIGRYAGSLDSNGGYGYGILTTSRGKFLGRLAADGSFLSGALHRDDKIYVADAYERGRPIGTVLVGDKDGTYSVQRCDAQTCAVVEKGHSKEINLVWSALSGVVVDRLTDVARLQLERALPLIARHPWSAGVSVALFALKQLVILPAVQRSGSLPVQGSSG